MLVNSELNVAEGFRCRRHASTGIVHAACEPEFYTISGPSPTAII